jgi:hypothetical protein
MSTLVFARRFREAHALLFWVWRFSLHRRGWRKCSCQIRSMQVFGVHAEWSCSGARLCVEWFLVPVSCMSCGALGLVFAQFSSN